MRIVLWLAISVFVSSLFWPQLLTEQLVGGSIVIFFLLLTIPRLRIFAVLPFVAIYFTCYTHLTLTGCLPFVAKSVTLPFVNNISLQAVVDGRDHSILVRVNSLISEKNRGYFIAKLLELDGKPLNYSPKLEMRWYKPTVQLQAGQMHRFKVRFKPVYGRANPAGFDRQKWRYSEHVAYIATIKAHLRQEQSAITLRAMLYQKIKALSQQLDNQGVILALAFADRSLISSDKKQQIQELSISHLFAISGLHIGLLFSFAYFLAQFLVSYGFKQHQLGWFTWRLVHFSALLVAFFYTYLAGFSLPTQRAFLMLLFAVLMLSLKRKHALFDLLTFTLAFILFFDPLAILSLSLWLSFFAVAIILAVIWRFPNREKLTTKTEFEVGFVIKRYLKFLLLLQVSLSLLMIPIQLLSFSAFSWLSPVINFIAVPLFSLLIIPLILIACVISSVSAPIAVFLFSVVDKVINLFFNGFVSAQPAYQVYSLNSINLIIAFTALVLLALIIHFHTYHNRYTFCLFALLLSSFVAVSIWQRKTDSIDTWSVEVLDVGQGLAVLVRAQEQTLLYDTGPRYPSGFSAAQSEIVPYLNLLGIDRLDYLFVSHSDIDHAGGVDIINQNFRPKQIISGEQIALNKQMLVNWKLCTAGDSWSLGTLEVVALSPYQLTKNNNNNSCVLRISDGKHSLLLTGDINKKQEQLLVANYSQSLQSNLLIAPHHGSKHSSSEVFLKTVAPQWGVFSAGFMNHWGFPQQVVKLRYKKQNIMMVNSGLSGFIRFNIEKPQIYMQTYREHLASYWYHSLFIYK